MEKFVTVRTFSESQDFELAKSYLESFQIECYGRDEIMNRTYFSNVNGGIKLDVRSDQSEEAIRILMEGGYIRTEDFEPSAEIKWVTKFLDLFRKK